ncbi:MAG TPA: SUMF1/EgtB/PvdO family nonheme iron enzyme [Polyangiaceae bacterium]
MKRGFYRVPVLDSLLSFLPLVVSLLPLAPPLPGWLGVDAAPLVALALVTRLPEPCPVGMVLVDGGYCPKFHYECINDLGTAESARCGEYARRSSCTSLLEPRRFCIDRYEWPNLVGENPRVYVSWFQAKELCWTVGKRLCRRSEWMLACEGPKRMPYPYGFVRQPSPCNVDRGSVTFDIEAMLNPKTREAELSRLWQADPLGSHPACVSPFGAYDMSGNVDEWTDHQGDDPTTSDPSTLNGGYWGPVRDTCRLTTRAHAPTFRFYQVGFRCCSDANDGIETAPIVMHPSDRLVR